jgi:Ca-activated chloride channel family protein
MCAPYNSKLANSLSQQKQGKTMTRAARLSVILLSAGLAVSCAKNSDLGSLQTRIDAMETELSSPQRTAAGALSTAQGAEATAAGATPEARAARNAAEEARAKLDRGFRKGPLETGGFSKGAFKDDGSAGNVSSLRPSDSQSAYYQDQGRDRFQEIKANPVKLVRDEPVSTFSIDVDTASYAFVRAALNRNVLPQKDAVRLEELINYFPYDYAVPDDREEPFKASTSVFPTPWNADTKLLHIGIKGYQIDSKAKPRSNLVFLIDTSGSMHEPNKLPLVQSSLKMLLDVLDKNDSVAIVTYAGTAGIALEPTRVGEKHKIFGIIDNLAAGGSTAGAEGIRQAYQLAERNFDKEGINRVILATDGDFNVGITDVSELKSFIERKRDSGIYLSVLGYGMGNYNDRMMQALAQNGNGNAAYIDTLGEARKALVEEAGSTLFPIARDVKIQVEFNPAKVAEYRLIGYETRLLNREDFNNDKVDAGDIGAGHAVTALYEITPVGGKGRLVDDLRYQTQAGRDTEPDEKGEEYAFVKIRYKLPKSDTSRLITTPVDGRQEYRSLEEVPVDARFAASVAAFGQLLHGAAYLKRFAYDDVAALAERARGADPFGYRAEFINLVRLAKNAPALPVQLR